MLMLVWCCLVGAFGVQLDPQSLVRLQARARGGLLYLRVVFSKENGRDAAHAAATHTLHMPHAKLVSGAYTI